MISMVTSLLVRCDPQTVPSDVEGVFAMLDWLAFVPRARESPVPIMPALDPVDRPIEFTPTKTPYDPRWMIAGHGKPGMLSEIEVHYLLAAYHQTFTHTHTHTQVEWIG